MTDNELKMQPGATYPEMTYDEVKEELINQLNDISRDPRLDRGVGELLAKFTTKMVEVAGHKLDAKRKQIEIGEQVQLLVSLLKGAK